MMPSTKAQFLVPVSGIRSNQLRGVATPAAEVEQLRHGGRQLRLPPAFDFVKTSGSSFTTHPDIVATTPPGWVDEDQAPRSFRMTSKLDPEPGYTWINSVDKAFRVDFTAGENSKYKRVRLGNAVVVGLFRSGRIWVSPYDIEASYSVGDKFSLETNVGSTHATLLHRDSSGQMVDEYRLDFNNGISTPEDGFQVQLGFWELESCLQEVLLFYKPPDMRYKGGTFRTATRGDSSNCDGVLCYFGADDEVVYKDQDFGIGQFYNMVQISYALGYNSESFFNIDMKYVCSVGTAACSNQWVTIASIKAQNTNGWENFVTESFAIDPEHAGGLQGNVEIRLKGQNSNGYVANIDWFEFRLAKNGGGRYEAELFQVGLSSPNVESNGYALTQFHGHDEVAYAARDFGDECLPVGTNCKKWVRVRYSLGYNPVSYFDIEVKDASDNLWKTLASIEVKNTNGWDSYVDSYFSLDPEMVGQLHGNVEIRLKGQNAGGYVANIDFFEFVEAPPKPPFDPNMYYTISKHDNSANRKLRATWTNYYGSNSDNKHYQIKKSGDDPIKGRDFQWRFEYIYEENAYRMVNREKGLPAGAVKQGSDWLFGLDITQDSSFFKTPLVELVPVSVNENTGQQKWAIRVFYDQAGYRKLRYSGDRLRLLSAEHDVEDELFYIEPLVDYYAADIDFTLDNQPIASNPGRSENDAVNAVYQKYGTQLAGMVLGSITGGKALMFAFGFATGMSAATEGPSQAAMFRHFAKSILQRVDLMITSSHANENMKQAMDRLSVNRLEFARSWMHQVDFALKQGNKVDVSLVGTLEKVISDQHELIVESLVDLSYDPSDDVTRMSAQQGYDFLKMAVLESVIMIENLVGVLTFELLKSNDGGDWTCESLIRKYVLPRTRYDELMSYLIDTVNMLMSIRVGTIDEMEVLKADVVLGPGSSNRCELIDKFYSEELVVGIFEKPDAVALCNLDDFPAAIRFAAQSYMNEVKWDMTHFSYPSFNEEDNIADLWEMIEVNGAEKMRLTFMLEDICENVASDPDAWLANEEFVL